MHVFVRLVVNLSYDIFIYQSRTCSRTSDPQENPLGLQVLIYVVLKHITLMKGFQADHALLPGYEAFVVKISF